MTKNPVVVFFCCTLLLLGCEKTDVTLVAAAGGEALRALTLSDEQVRQIAAESVQSADARNTLAPSDNDYALRLQRLVGTNLQEGSQKFACGVYLSPDVNAFAMADGTIRVFSGLMDLLDDGEVRFVVGHEMGHVAKSHIREKLRLAYAASAVRKGVASQSNAAGEVARSFFGDLSESLLNAQFSQIEEKEADDYGLLFLKREGCDPRAAVSALEKLSRLSKGHSFLSTHPDPEKRAERLQAQVDGRAVSIDEGKQSMLRKISAFMANGFPYLYKQLRNLLPG